VSAGLECITRDMSREELEAALPGTRRHCLDGIEDYLFIGGDRFSAQQAAERLGVTPRTIQRYRSVLRAAAEAATGVTR
jgi:response regulator of citrate/malate metabolism